MLQKRLLEVQTDQHPACRHPLPESKNNEQVLKTKVGYQQFSLKLPAIATVTTETIADSSAPTSPNRGPVASSPQSHPQTLHR